MKTNFKKVLAFFMVLALVVSCFTCAMAVTATAAEETKTSVNMRYPEGLAKAFTMSFDDARKNDARAIATFQKYGLKSTFFISTGLLGQASALYANLDEAVAAYGNTGMEVAAHTVNHKDLPTVFEEQGNDGLAAEITADITAIENAFGTDVLGIAYPGAPPYKVTDDNVIAFLKDAGVGYARTASSSNNFDIPTDWYRWTATTWVGAVNDVKNFGTQFVNAKVDGAPLLYYIWGHAYDVDDEWESYDEFDAFAQSMSGKDDIWYATNGEIYSYVNAYNQMTVSVENDTVTNPTDKDLWFEYAGKTYKIAAGETVKGLFTDLTVNVSVTSTDKIVDLIVDSAAFDSFANPTAIFTQDGNETRVDSYTINGAKYVFSFRTTSNSDVSIKFTAGEFEADEIVCALSRFDELGSKYVIYTKIDLGDANQDGTTDVKDLVRTKKIVALLADANQDADISGDGEVTTGDLVAIAKLIVSGKKGLKGFTVTFTYDDYSPIETVVVPEGFKATASVVPTKEGYGFAGWSGDLSNITTDINAIAQFGTILPEGGLEGTIPEDWELGD